MHGPAAWFAFGAVALLFALVIYALGMMMVYGTNSAFVADARMIGPLAAALLIVTGYAGLAWQRFRPAASRFARGLLISPATLTGGLLFAVFSWATLTDFGDAILYTPLAAYGAALLWAARHVVSRAP